MRVRALVEVEVEDPNPNPKWKTEERGREKHGRHEEEGNTRTGMAGMNRDEPGGIIRTDRTGQGECGKESCGRGQTRRPVHGQGSREGRKFRPPRLRLNSG